LIIRINAYLNTKQAPSRFATEGFGVCVAVLGPVFRCQSGLEVFSFNTRLGALHPGHRLRKRPVVAIVLASRLLSEPG
jgi:hypothetical protein